MRAQGVAAEAERIYRESASRLAEVAAEQRDAGHPLYARKFALRAYIALNAARAEVFDPETVIGPWCLCDACQRFLFRVRFDQLVRGDLS